MNMYYSVNRGWINISFNNTARGTYSPPTPSFPSIPPFHLPPARPEAKRDDDGVIPILSSRYFLRSSPPRPSSTASPHVARIIHGALNLVWDYYVSFHAPGTNIAIFDVYLVRESRAIFQCCDRRDNTRVFSLLYGRNRILFKILSIYFCKNKCSNIYYILNIVTLPLSLSIFFHIIIHYRARS